MRESMNVYISNPRFTISCISYIYIYIGHRDVAELLVGAGADVNHADKYGKTALMRASEEGRANATWWSSWDPRAGTRSRPAGLGKK